MLTAPVLAIVVATVGLGSAWAIFALKSQTLACRIFFSLSTFGIAGAALRTAALTASSPLRQWNGARLAPLIALTRGIPLYGDSKTGVLSAWIYGPIPALAYLPTALFHRPTACIILAVILSQLMILGPAIVALTLFSRHRKPSGYLIGPLVIGIAWCILVRSESLIDGTFFVLSEAPASGLIGVICLLLIFKRSQTSVIVSALLTVLACWCKQTILPFAAVPLVFLMMDDEMKFAIVYLRWLITFGIVVSAILIPCFGARNMWFNTVTIPSRQPLRFEGHGFVFAISRAIVDWLGEAAMPMIPLGIALAIAIIWKPARPLRWRSWVVFLLASLSLLPSSLLGYAKVSGFYGNFAISQFFLLIGGCAAAIDAFTQLAAARPSAANCVASGLCLFLLILGVTADATKPGRLAAMSAQIAAPSNNPEEVIFDFDRAHPGAAYFPWDPLPPLLAEDRLFNFEWGYVDRLTADLPPSTEQIQMHTPPRMQFIALPPRTTTRFALRFFPAFSEPARLSSLPGFTVFQRPARQ